ncbi:hypothetical protein [Oceanobacter mangrovi]|uniref:hypothetical protein n=1 Tax=Oceanobacter mangrovi TaxID=2862510 RepID=UPI001C8F1C73|nr:hypothetical protein [Oceanobacter mangrovi]
MYTDEELNTAVQQGIFNQQAVERFRAMVEQRRASPSVDEENFRLLSGFNDVFVVIACMVLLVSAFWLVSDTVAGGWLVALLSWGLAEFFVRKRRMALPAIALLLSFAGGAVFGLGYGEHSLGDDMSVWPLLVLALLVGLHWWRFRVPITVAAGTATLMLYLIGLGMKVWPEDTQWLLFLVAGLAVFMLAMWWDLSDRQRLTHRADVAFWLHLLAAPLIVHPLFLGVGFFDDGASSSQALFVIVAYLVLVVLSLVIDRRAFMVSSLGYVIYALNQLLDDTGIEIGAALVGVVMGSALLLLSAWWHAARRQLVQRLPPSWQARLP